VISPALLAYVQNKIKKVNKKYQACVLSNYPLYRLMTDVIINIYEGTYQEKEKNYKDKYTELEKILHESELE
jgi:exopolysaccharide biosynthesis predicted pyruvyltransferase EpsI